MQVNLEDKVVRFLVREYTNKIVNYHSEAELKFCVRKLIHTFQVTQTAQDLIDLTDPPLPKKLQKTILNAAILHDIGRCHEFRNGIPLKNADHGQMGAVLIEKAFPNLKVEIESTRYHNKVPSAADRTFDLPVLDYVRDADMLGNIRAQIEDFILFVTWLPISLEFNKPLDARIDPELPLAMKEHRAYIRSNCKINNYLTMILGELTWINILKTPAAHRMVQKEHLFTRFRDMLLDTLPVLFKEMSVPEKELRKTVMAVFPNHVLELKGDA